MTALLVRLALVVMAALAMPLGHAAETAPDAMLKALTMEVLAALRHDQSAAAGEPARVADLIETRILPLFDFRRMTQSAVALSWRHASSAQQAALVTEFRTLLVRTYSTALSSYRDQEIEFKRLHAAPDDAEVTVKSLIRQSGTAAIAMDYDMERIASEWKVYDIKIEGVSLVTTYRNTFAAEVRTGGVDGLIRSLSDKNRQSDARFRSRRMGDFYLPASYQSMASHGRRLARAPT